MMDYTLLPEPKRRRSAAAFEAAKDAARAAYSDMLQAHDWTFEFSDDHSVWRAGRQNLSVLLNLQPVLDPDLVLWNLYAPKEFCK